MAGIGFALRRQAQDGVLAPVASLAHASVIAAGPWLLMVTALALVALLSRAHVTTVELEAFRLILVTAFVISMIVSSPLILVASRLVGDAVHALDIAIVGPLLLVTLVGAGGVSFLATAGILAVLSNMSAMLIAATAGLAATAAFVWVSLAFCGAVRNFGAISAGFVTGLSVAVGLTVLAAAFGAGRLAMIVAFQTGFIVVFAMLSGRVLASFPAMTTPAEDAARRLAAGLRTHWRVAAGALAGTLAIWADKFVVWLGPLGVVHPVGVVHAPAYDSAVFLAGLTILPALAMFVTHVETTFLTRYLAVQQAIARHATYRQIETAIARFEASTSTTLTRIFLLQAAVTVAIAAGAHVAYEWQVLQYEQLGIFRFATLASFFQFAFFAGASLLLFLDRQGPFLGLQLFFFAVQIGANGLMLSLGPAAYGFGYLFASVVAAIAAMIIFDRSLRAIPYISFILSNHRPRPRHPSAAWPFPPTGLDKAGAKI
jgi:uncharacterized membrane protein